MEPFISTSADGLEFAGATLRSAIMPAVTDGAMRSSRASSRRLSMFLGAPGLRRRTLERVMVSGPKVLRRLGQKVTRGRPPKELGSRAGRPIPNYGNTGPNCLRFAGKWRVKG